MLAGVLAGSRDVDCDSPQSIRQHRQRSKSVDVVARGLRSRRVRLADRDRPKLGRYNDNPLYQPRAYRTNLTRLVTRRCPRQPARSDPAGDEKNRVRSIFARRDNVPPYVKTRSPVPPGMKVLLSVEVPGAIPGLSPLVRLWKISGVSSRGRIRLPQLAGTCFDSDRCRVCQDPTPFSHKIPTHPRSVFSRSDRPWAAAFDLGLWTSNPTFSHALSTI
jgi:hypothetical protein